MAPLESLACGTPAVCTAVGGLARILPGYAMLTPRRDPEAMAAALQWTAEHRKEAREIALRGREMVVREWGHIDAFRELAAVLEQASHGIGRQAATS